MLFLFIVHCCDSKVFTGNDYTEDDINSCLNGDLSIINLSDMLIYDYRGVWIKIDTK